VQFFFLNKTSYKPVLRTGWITFFRIILFAKTYLLTLKSKLILNIYILHAYKYKFSQLNPFNHIWHLCQEKYKSHILWTDLETIYLNHTSFPDNTISDISIKHLRRRQISRLSVNWKWSIIEKHGSFAEFLAKVHDIILIIAHKQGWFLFDLHTWKRKERTNSNVCGNVNKLNRHVYL
jgi:hypothetical protein